MEKARKLSENINEYEKKYANIKAMLAARPRQVRLLQSENRQHRKKEYIEMLNSSTKKIKSLKKEARSIYNNKLIPAYKRAEDKASKAIKQKQSRQ